MKFYSAWLLAMSIGAVIAAGVAAAFWISARAVTAMFNRWFDFVWPPY